jgi:molybdate transport system ATP-binding protein
VSETRLDMHIRHTLQTANGPVAMEIDLSAATGEVLAVTGDSGSGKTTLLRQIAGLTTPERGRIVFGSNIWLDTSTRISLAPQKRNIGFVFQDYALFPHYTVLENLRFPLNKNDDMNRVDELLEVIELTSLAHRKPHQLSGGQQQRVALARALVKKPDLLLLDEPLAALDPSMRARLQDYLSKLHEQYGFTMLIVTHDVGEIFSLAHQVAVLDHGKIAKKGTPSEVFVSRSEDETTALIYGKILNIETFPDHLVAKILLQKSIRTIKVPLSKKDEILPGRSVVFKAAIEDMDMELLG